MQKRVVFLLFALFGAGSLSAQTLTTEVVFRVESSQNELGNRQKSYLKQLNQIQGFRMSPEDFAQGEVVLLASDLSVFSKTQRRWLDGIRWVANYPNSAQEEYLLRRWKIRRQLRQQYYDYWFNTYTSPNAEVEREELPSKMRRKMRLFGRVLRGKKKSGLPDTYVWYLHFGPTKRELPHRYQVDWLTGNKAYATVFFDTVRAELAARLPKIELADCRLVDRGTRFLEFQQNIFQAFEYKPYVASDRIRRVRRFALSFDKNQVEYDEGVTQEIVRFLADSSYQVAKAQVRGMASVEGDSANNIRLMQARAEVLVQTLQEGQEEEIVLETETFENWPLFYQQLLKVNFDTATYSKAEWKELFYKDSVAEALEPMLAEQRRADLRLYLYQLLEEDEQLDYTFRLYRQALTRLRRARTPQEQGRFLRVLIGIRLYLHEAHGEGRISWEELEFEAPAWGNVPDALPVLYAVQLIKEYQQGNWVPEDFADRVMAGHSAAVRLMEEGTESLQVYFTRQAAALQVYVFNQLLEGAWDTQRICEMKYPETPRYYALILNYYHFLDVGGQYLLGTNPCLAQGNRVGTSADVWVSSAEGHPLDTVQASQIDVRHSRYYYFLKRSVLDKDEEIARYARRVGDYYMFDLMEIVNYNVEGWEVAENRMFDEEIDLLRLDDLVKELLTYRGRICPHSLFPLVLEYHRRFQTDILLHPEKLQDKKVFQRFKESKKWVLDYYVARKGQMTPEEAQLVTRHLLAVNAMFLDKKVVRESYRIMHAARTSEALGSYWGKEYANLAIMAAPRPLQMMPEMLSEVPEAVTEGWQRGFLQVHPELWQRYLSSGDLQEQ